VNIYSGSCYTGLIDSLPLLIYNKLRRNGTRVSCPSQQRGLGDPDTQDDLAERARIYVAPDIKADYKKLRKINPEAARRAVLDYLESNNQNISDAAAAFGINRTVVYDIIRRSREGGLEDRPRVPKRQPRKTPRDIENKVVQTKNKTDLNPRQLSEYLKEHEGISIPAGTVRHILERAEKNHRLIDIHLIGG
jgi:transposase